MVDPILAVHLHRACSPDAIRSHNTCQSWVHRIVASSRHNRQLPRRAFGFMHSVSATPFQYYCLINGHSPVFEARRKTDTETTSEVKLFDRILNPRTSV